jgi:hypothetical protein
MRRALVLTSESARHPFRQRLPRHVLAPLPPAEIAKREPVTDTVFFLTSFVASFIIIFGMIV